MYMHISDGLESLKLNADFIADYNLSGFFCNHLTRCYVIQGPPVNSAAVLASRN